VEFVELENWIVGIYMGVRWVLGHAFGVVLGSCPLTIMQLLLIPGAS
jgi:hypothetical protein